jgi:RsiW-degrading membrane proteinase PrsW (M82 family)
MNILPLPTSSSTETENNIQIAPVPGRWHLLAPLLALAGGIFGIFGAAYNEFFHGSLLVSFVGAPIIEEMLKPCGVYVLLAKWSHVLRNRFYTAFLSALGGLSFALIENLVYLNIYVPQHTQALVIWRYTVCVGVHMVCSFIFGFGINRELMASVKGERKFLSSGKRFFIPAMAIHSLYNISTLFFGSIFVIK